MEIFRGGDFLRNKEKLKIPKNILENAITMNMKPELILKISQVIDKYIIEYYRSSTRDGVGENEEKFL